MKLKAWLKMVRIENLAILVLIFLVFKYAFINKVGVATALNNFYYFLLILSVIFVAAGGNIINNIYDKKVDKINKPGKNPVGKSISEKRAYLVYGVLSALGVGLGYFLSYVVGINSLGTIQFIAFLLLWMYSTDFKHRFILGNILVAFLSALVILMIPVFDFIPANKGSMDNYSGLLWIYGAYAGFSFLTSFIREIVKDQEDVEGDRRVGSRTLASLYNTSMVKIVVLVLSLILLSGLGASIWFFSQLLAVVFYIAILLFLPTLFLMYKVYKAQSKAHWAFCSMLIKGVMLAGILSVAAITYLS